MLLVAFILETMSLRLSFVEILIIPSPKSMLPDIFSVSFEFTIAVPNALVMGVLDVCLCFVAKEITSIVCVLFF